MQLNAELASTHKFVALNRCGDANIARMLGAATQNATEATHTDWACLRQLVGQRHDNFDRCAAPKAFGEMKIQAPRADFARFGFGLAHNGFVCPADGKRQSH